MAPPTASFTSAPVATGPSPAALKQQAANKQKTFSLPRQHYDIKAGQEPKEDYDGNFQFADIKESITSRAMTARYYEDMMNAGGWH